EPKSGTLYFNNIHSNLIGPKDLYHHIGIMTQETFLFNASLKENIIFSNPHASEQDIYHALEKAQLANFVAALPEGILTNLGKRGMQISGGEKQRIGLARLFVCNPDIAIFDEPTSALDHKTEREIIESIKTLDSKTTKIIITHKKELASLADTILYVDKGTVQQYDLDTFLKKN
ncbi:MAG: ATP-binding cassette domain-containing protein, partial [Candidatus Babeliales bacterium]